MDLLDLDDLPRMSQGVNVISWVPDAELKYRLIDSFQISVYNDSFIIDHAVNLHNFDLKLEGWERLVRDVGLFQSCRVVEY